jgi:hypothetical protein
MSRFASALRAPALTSTALVQPYLPTPKTKPPTTKGGKSKFGIRRFLRSLLHLFVYTIIHAFFSVYIRLRKAYHAVRDRAHSVLYYHHRTPELIERDVKGFSRLPKHLSVILTVDDDARGGGELEKLVSEAAEIAAWCASAGIPKLSIYERTGASTSSNGDCTLNILVACCSRFSS